MVIKSSTPMPVSGEGPLRKAPDIEAPKPVSGFGFSRGTAEKPPKSDFKLPDSVSTEEIAANSHKYGGGRSAGGGTQNAPVRRGRGTDFVPGSGESR